MSHRGSERSGVLYVSHRTSERQIQATGLVLTGVAAIDCTEHPHSLLSLAPKSRALPRKPENHFPEKDLHFWIRDACTRALTDLGPRVITMAKVCL